MGAGLPDRPGNDGGEVAIAFGIALPDVALRPRHRTPAQRDRCGPARGQPVIMVSAQSCSVVRAKEPSTSDWAKP